MDRHCKDCSTQLVIGDNWTDARKKAWVYVCKACNRLRGKKHYKVNKEHYHAYNKQYKESKKDGLYHVYTVDNYAGQTTNVWRRKVDHKHSGKDMNTFRVLYSTPDYSDALELEALLHDEGYEGRHMGGRYAR